MTNNSGLPFTLTNEAVAEWLDLLGKLPPSRAASQLSQVLKQLKDTDSEATQLLPVLVDLTPLTLRLANALNTSLLSETNPAEKSAKVAKLCMQLPRQLSLIFCHLAENGLLTGVELQSAIYHALQLIGHCLRFYALHYEAPSATLWKKSALLYRLSVSRECLTSRLSSKIGEFKAHTSIESVIKRNLLFCIIGPRLYSHQEIELLFPLVDQLAPMLEIASIAEAGDFGFYWDLSGDTPPCPTKHIKRPLPAGYLAINSRRIGNMLQIGEIATNLQPALQNKLALQLTGYGQIFSSIIPGLPSRSDLILGFTRICAYLQEQNKLIKIMQLSAQMSGTQIPKRNMTLVPLDYERNVFQVTDQPFGKPLAHGKAVNILKTPNQHYAIAEGRAFDCATGDIALLCKEQHPDTLVIIRQQSEHDLTGSTHILLEKQVGHCSIHGYASETGIQHVIMIDEDGDSPEVFLSDGKHTVDSKLNIIHGKTLRLTACLEANAFFARFRVSVDS